MLTVLHPIHSIKHIYLCWDYWKLYARVQGMKVVFCKEPIFRYRSAALNSRTVPQLHKSRTTGVIKVFHLPEPIGYIHQHIGKITRWFDTNTESELIINSRICPLLCDPQIGHCVA